MAAAVVAAIALTLLLPDDFRPRLRANCRGRRKGSGRPIAKGTATLEAALQAGSEGVQTKFGHAVDCFAAGRHPELAVEGVHLALHGVPGDEQPVTDFGERKVRGQQR
jgi:hypothetical protein